MGKKEKETLVKLRRRIDRIDDRIVGLLDERIAVAIKTADLKKHLGERLHQPMREADVLKRVATRSKLFPKRALKTVYQAVMKAALSMENPRRRR